MFDPELGDRFTWLFCGKGAGVYGVSGIFWGGRLGTGGCGFLLQSSFGWAGNGWGGIGVGRLFPLGSVTVGAVVTGAAGTGLGGVGGGTRRGGCGEERRGGAGGGTGSGATTGAVLWGTGGGWGGCCICGGGNCNKNIDNVSPIYLNNNRKLSIPLFTNHSKNNNYLSRQLCFTRQDN